ncbi:BirA family biotin operon repressor/biotin-[acetyl-CoA-carboxylase] ligase [Weissella uvarum]|uniref:biotin--[acetyl-CoA-carboxylase] ligase n=1 Tax=Weissella uvarum TaxID=1479233 RepID=UPI001961143E|nr:biotin--[acetyl-CoA-carboxylase] ligase [Weissella uvarum]MBM7617668.1 BirA family biotin operon repressor/biotin-[acetyl-CoA-carboxylase] ligase [Weissella uvarum]MCM0596017.1 biotin--[acetyl-CoA-carboxylase] ligase [Weissella uvarum]
MKINQTKIQAALPEVAVEVFDEIDSTNRYAKALVTAPHYTNQARLVVANQQTNGYGRQKRAFFSPADVGIYMSLMFPLEASQFTHPGTLTLNVAVAVQQVLAEQLGVELDIKWVNDLYHNQRKVVGILVEVPQAPTAVEAGTVVIGMGINLNQSDVPTELAQKVGAITDESIQREQLIVALQRACQKVIQLPFSALREQYLAHSLLQNRMVSLHVNQQDIVGKVVDVDEQGRLVLETKQQRMAFTSGEVTKVNFSS